jgi:hypothetical protein
LISRKIVERKEEKIETDKKVLLTFGVSIG